jgi:hypothetical protein
MEPPPLPFLEDTERICAGVLASITNRGMLRRSLGKDRHAALQADHAAGAQTEGSMNVIVKTNEGDANICGDVIYDINDQVVEPCHEIGDMEPRVTGNHGTTKRQEKAAIKKVLARSRFVLPIHDFPALIEGSQVVNWFPA